MKFLVDAQLPRRLAGWLTAAGHDAIHTLDLPDRNRTADLAIADRADADRRTVVSKDSDFVDSHILHGRPAKLLLIFAGNLTNVQLAAHFIPLIPALASQLEANNFIELGWLGVIIRG